MFFSTAWLLATRAAALCDRLPAAASDLLDEVGWSGHPIVLADTYGALLLVLLTKWFYEQGSGESGGAGQARAE